MKFILPILVILTSHIINAQHFKTSYLPGPENTERTSIVYKGEIFAIDVEYNKKGLTSIKIRKYDKELKSAGFFDLSDGEKVYGPAFPSLKNFNDKLYLLYYMPKGEGYIRRMAAEVNTETLVPGEPVELQVVHPDERSVVSYRQNVNPYQENMPVDMLNIYNSPRKMSKSFFFEPSPDSSKVLIVWTTAKENKIFYSIVDKDMKQIASGDALLTGIKREVAIGCARLDNSGNAYFIYHYNEGRVHMTELMAITRAGRKIVKAITLPGCEVSYTFVTPNHEGNGVIVTGTYKENSENLTGVFNQQFDPVDGKFTKPEKTAFTQDMVEVLAEEGAASKKKNYGLSEDWIVGPIELTDGTLALAGEFRRSTSTERARYDITGSILVARFNSGGAIFSRIPKVRVSAGTTYGDSYRVFEFKNKLIFFYSDHMANLQMDLSQKPSRSDNYSKSVFAAATVDEKGNVKREVVLDLSAESYLAENMSMCQLSESSYYVPFRRIKRMGGLTDDLKWVIMRIE